jgi:CheY-like chemotaxis protein
MKPGSKILLVDDNDDFRQVLKTVLEGKGFGVGEAHDGKEALERMAKELFNMAIVDLDMPRMNGLDFTRAIKKQTPLFPVMMITAYAQFYSPGEILAAGVDAFLQKPVDFARLWKAIENL